MGWLVMNGGWARCAGCKRIFDLHDAKELAVWHSGIHGKHEQEDCRDTYSHHEEETSRKVIQES